MSYSYILTTRDQYPKIVGAWHQKYLLLEYLQKHPEHYYRAFRASGTEVTDISDESCQEAADKCFVCTQPQNKKGLNWCKDHPVRDNVPYRAGEQVRILGGEFKHIIGTVVRDQGDQLVQVMPCSSTQWVWFQTDQVRRLNRRDW